MSDDLSHDATTHRYSWIKAFEAMEINSQGDGDYWRHEKLALIKFLDWFAEQQKTDAAKLSALEAENRKLREAGRAVVDQWDTPNWKLTEATAPIMNRLRVALTTGGTDDA